MTQHGQMMEIPVLTRQVAEVVEIKNIPLLRQFDIPYELETEPSPKPDELDQAPQDREVKIVDDIKYIAFHGDWYPIEHVETTDQPEDLAVKIVNGIKCIALYGHWYIECMVDEKEEFRTNEVFFNGADWYWCGSS